MSRLRANLLLLLIGWTGSNAQLRQGSLVLKHCIRVLADSTDYGLLGASGFGLDVVWVTLAVVSRYVASSCIVI